MLSLRMYYLGQNQSIKLSSKWLKDFQYLVQLHLYKFGLQKSLSWGDKMSVRWKENLLLRKLKTSQFGNVGKMLLRAILLLTNRKMEIKDVRLIPNWQNSRVQGMSSYIFLWVMCPIEVLISRISEYYMYYRILYFNLLLQKFWNLQKSGKE